MSRKVLVVDDDALVREVLVRHLDRWGYEVGTAGDAAAAESAVQDGRFDLILLDNVLPGPSGLTAARGLAQKSGAPVLLMTGHLDEELKKDAGLLGVTEVLSKPLDFDALERRLRQILGKGGPSPGTR